MNLLIVDDHPTNLKLLRAQLESEGHAVFEAHDGVDALALLERQRVDVVISDILMPRMDGYRLCYEIRKLAHLRDLPIIIYTSTYTAPGETKLALDVGADKYLKRPASIETIMAALHEVIAQTHTAPRPAALAEVEVLWEYSEQLVSKLKEKNTELVVAEDKFRTLVEQSIVGIYIIQDGQFVYVNPRMLEILGLSEEKMASRTLSDFIVPEDYALARENIRKRISGGVPSVHYSLRVLHQSGAVLQVEVHGSRTDYNGRPAVMGTLLDITERKRAEEALRQSEERYRLLFERIPDIIFALAPTGAVTSLNHAFETITGWPQAQWLGRPFQELIHPDDRNRAGELFQLVLRGERGPTVEVRVGTAAGGHRDVEFIGFSSQLSGDRIEVQGIGRDITERLQFEARYRQAQKMEIVGQLAGGVAHDFNNLLTVIFGYSDILLRGLEPGPLYEATQEVRRAGERAAGLTRQLLAFSRKQALVPEVLDLGDVISGLSTMVERLIGEDVKVSVVVSPNLGRVKADRGQLEQVVMNLAVNARDAMPKGGSLIFELQNVELDGADTAMHAEVKPGPYVLLAISDTGTGMDVETQKRIFEPFFTTKEVGKGTGLGLSTVFGIVKQSGGEIGVYSVPGEGTIFKIYLPRVRAETGESKMPSSPRILRARPGETVLMVEDDETVGRVTRSMLSDLGYDVLAAAQGEEALEIAAHHPRPIDLLLTDVVMPGMRGPEVANRLLAIRPETRVVFMSGYAEELLLNQAAVQETALFLPKPFTSSTLGSKLREALDAVPLPGPMREKGGVPGEQQGAGVDGGRKPLSILQMDDDKDILEITRFFLAEDGHRVAGCLDVEETLARYADALARGERFDLVILDLSIPGKKGGVEGMREILKLDPTARIVACSGAGMSEIGLLESGFVSIVEKPFTSESLKAILHLL
jgi:two-component system cell cycle sensor histidine kinase/response regulator CckA